MKKEQVAALFSQFEQACYIYNSIECWSARELQSILGYTKWDNFLRVIEKAKKACENAGLLVSDHFADIGKMVSIGSTTGGMRVPTKSGWRRAVKRSVVCQSKY